MIRLIMNSLADNSLGRRVALCVLWKVLGPHFVFPARRVEKNAARTLLFSGGFVNVIMSFRG